MKVTARGLSGDRSTVRHRDHIPREARSGRDGRGERGGRGLKREGNSLPPPIPPHRVVYDITDYPCRDSVRLRDGIITKSMTVLTREI